MTSAGSDLTLVLFWASLGISAAVVILFLWLMRESEPQVRAGGGAAPADPSARGARPEATPSAEPSQDARS